LSEGRYRTNGGLFLVNTKKWSIWIAVILVIALTTSIYYYAEWEKNSNTSIAMFMYVEKKEHYIESGKYMKMWVIGSNPSDSSPNKLKYKVMIKDARIYNLLEEGKKYFVDLEGIKKKNQSEYTYTFGQLSIPGGTQLRGKGIIE
jgi:hypothetical protein